MPDNPLLQLRELGQSVWLDTIDRGLLAGGMLQQLVQRGEIQGVTSNPTIFRKAIAGCSDYDSSISALSASGQDTLAIWEALSSDDIRTAALVLAPVYRSTEGRDGYVSIEVAPALAHDVEGTIAEAKHLFSVIGQPNVMIKIPATREGVRAITELIASGVNVNATLIFSPDNYMQVAHAYIAGLERLEANGMPLNSVASVASFFVSRIDTAVDRQLLALLEKTTDLSTKRAIRSLLGQAAIANCRIAYHQYTTIIGSEPFASQRQRGARTQRLLWASTSAKNPAYRDVVYVEELIGPDTVNTMPPATLEAFRDHGQVRSSLEEDVDHAFDLMDQLERTGVDMAQIYEDLQVAGIQAFAESFDGVLGCIRERQAQLSKA